MLPVGICSIVWGWRHSLLAATLPAASGISPQILAGRVCALLSEAEALPNLLTLQQDSRHTRSQTAATYHCLHARCCKVLSDNLSLLRLRPAGDLE